MVKQVDADYPNIIPSKTSGNPPSRRDDDLADMLARVEVVKRLHRLVKGKGPVQQRRQLDLALVQEVVKLLEISLRANRNTPANKSAIDLFVEDMRPESERT